MWSPLNVHHPKAASERSPVPDDEAAHFVGKVHENLRAFAGLRIFISDVQHLFTVFDILEVLNDGVSYRNNPQLRPDKPN